MGRHIVQGCVEDECRSCGAAYWCDQEDRNSQRMREPEPWTEMGGVRTRRVMRPAEDKRQYGPPETK